jgi:hypothetical protein
MPSHPDRVRRHYASPEASPADRQDGQRIGECLACQRPRVPLAIWMRDDPEVALCTRCYPRPPRLIQRPDPRSSDVDRYDAATVRSLRERLHAAEARVWAIVDTASRRGELVRVPAEAMQAYHPRDSHVHVSFYSDRREFVFNTPSFTKLEID